MVICKRTLLILASVWFTSRTGVAATSDAVRMRIPNVLILYLLAGFAITVAVAQPGWRRSGNTCRGRSCDPRGRIVPVLARLDRRRRCQADGCDRALARAGGDTALLLLTALAGGVLTLLMIAARALGAGRLAGGRIAALRDPMDRVPYGIAIAAAAIAVVILRPEALLMG